MPLNPDGAADGKKRDSSGSNRNEGVRRMGLRFFRDRLPLFRVMRSPLGNVVGKLNYRWLISSRCSKQKLPRRRQTARHKNTVAAGGRFDGSNQQLACDAYEFSEHRSVRVRLTVPKQIRRQRPCASFLNQPSAESARSSSMRREAQAAEIENSAANCARPPCSGSLGVLTAPVRIRRWVRAGVHEALPAAGFDP